MADEAVPDWRCVKGSVKRKHISKSFYAYTVA